MKKIISLLSMAALVVMSALITSCNKMEEAGSGHRVNPDGSITYTTTLHMGADTKTVIGEDGTHTFKVGDQIAVAYYNTKTVQVKAVSNPLTGDDIKNNNKSARFTVTLTEAPKVGSNSLDYIYPASMTTDNGDIDYTKLNSQHGTLDLLASNLDCCKAAYISWNGSDDLPTRTLVNQITIGKFTIKNPSGTAINDDLTSVTITDNTNTRTYVITPAGGASTFSSDPIWVAMRPMSAETSVTITATDGTNSYEKTISVPASLGNGKITPINVTMTLVPSIPTGAIDGLFSVSSTKQVYFSQGNLQYQASTGTWRFAEHQYDFIGDYNVMASETYTGWIDLYPWGTSGIDYTGHATVYRPWETAYSSEYINPYSSLTTNLYDGEGENAGKADWGYNAISNGGNTQNSGWRTLKNNTTDNEWQYIFNSRTTANEINSTSNARYTQARINTDGTLVKGIILFPDGSIGDTPSGVTWSTINATSYGWKNSTQCTTAGWAALEAAGCVFLPASGKYNSGVSGAGDDGYYWSSSYADSEKAYGVFFDSSEVSPQYSDARYYGFSVRLVKDAN